MLSKTFNEEEVRAMFGPYGAVEDVSILRNAEGRSKGGGCGQRVGGVVNCWQELPVCVIFKLVLLLCVMCLCVFFMHLLLFL